MRGSIPLVIAALISGGCSSLTVPKESPSIEGSIVFWDTGIPTPPDVTPGVGIRVTRPDPFCDDITVFVDLTGDRLVKRLPDGSLEPITTKTLEEDLAEGRPIRAWTVEAVSGCPWSGTARFVEVEAE